MTGRSSLDKGARAEREAAALLADELGYTIRRKLGAGHKDDRGDLDVLDRSGNLLPLVIQVANWADTTRALRVKPVEAEQQRTNAQADYAVTLIRLRGGEWRAVLTIPQLSTLLRDVLN